MFKIYYLLAKYGTHLGSSKRINFYFFFILKSFTVQILVLTSNSPFQFTVYIWHNMQLYENVKGWKTWHFECFKSADFYFGGQIGRVHRHLHIWYLYSNVILREVGLENFMVWNTQMVCWLNNNYNWFGLKSQEKKTYELEWMQNFKLDPVSWHLKRFNFR